MAFTEFCCRSGGSNLNAGTRTGSSTVPGTAADLTYVSGTWVSATGVFTVASGDPVADGVAVGDFASVYDDAATVTTLIGRVTERTTTTITVSTTAKSGTTTDGTIDRTLKIGGAWAGPAAASAFPFSVITEPLKNAAGDLPRVNMSGSYDITSQLTLGASVSVSGFGTTYDDAVAATIDGGTGTGFNMMAFGNRCEVTDLIVQNNGSTGNSNDIIVGSAQSLRFFRVTVSGSRRTGFNIGGFNPVLIECEAYNCGVGGAANSSGFGTSVDNMLFVRCISRGHNTAANQHGFDSIGSGSAYVNCIAHNNSGGGIHFRSAGFTRQNVVMGCDLYDNATGIIFNTVNLGFGLNIQNCNLIKNSDFGIQATGGKTPTIRGLIANCGLGSGTAANGADFSGVDSEYITGSVTYAANVTPWADPDNGDFRITLAAAKNAGRGAFRQTETGQAGTIGYPDIGAAQSQGTGGTANPFTQQVIG